MKIGEIKIEALRLMFASVGDLDATEVADMEGDREVGAYLRAMPGSINRALSDLEMRRALPLSRHVIAFGDWERKGEIFRMELSKIPQIYEAVRLSHEDGETYGGELPFTVEGDVLTVRGLGEGEEVILLYRPRISRIAAWENEGELAGVPEEIAALIPYFIKGELFREDEPNEAGEARNWYEAALERLVKNTEERMTDADVRVHTVYSQVMM
ncbi:MAG: hypothetical protein E7643_01475 [Ruminococcaceae bacterium]|nr:hypothetical protein [Oscillospiraceae bacterium]